MPYTTTQDMLLHAQQHGYAVVGLAAYSLETMKILVETADRLGAPLMIQTTPRIVDHFGVEYIVSMVKIAASHVNIPVALHLDHGDTLQRVSLCLETGYSSIMIDGSRLPYEQNVALVQEAVYRAHACGVAVEAELGRIGGVEDDVRVEDYEKMLTDPDTVSDFVMRTHIDSLAIAMGTAHGMYRATPRLNLSLLKRVTEVTSIPIVLHGASGVPDDSVQAAIAIGIAKVNIATELKIAYAGALRDFLQRYPDETDVRKYLRPALDAYVDVVEHKLKVAGAVGRY